MPNDINGKKDNSYIKIKNDMFKRIDEKRNELGISLEEFSEKAGVSLNTYNAQKSRPDTIPKIDSIMEYANALNVSIDYLLYGADGTHYESQDLTSEEILNSIANIIDLGEGIVWVDTNDNDKLGYDALISIKSKTIKSFIKMYQSILPNKKNNVDGFNALKNACITYQKIPLVKIDENEYIILSDDDNSK